MVKIILHPVSDFVLVAVQYQRVNKSIPVATRFLETVISTLSMTPVQCQLYLLSLESGSL